MIGIAPPDTVFEKLNPFMPRPRSRELVEEHYRIPVRELFLSSSGIVGHANVIDVGGVPIKFWTIADENGVIEANGQSWFVQYLPRSRWRNSYDEYCASYYIVSPTGQRHRFLLVAGDGSGRVGTRSEIGTRYYSERRNRELRRIERRAEIIRELMLNNRPDDMSLVYVPMPPKPTRQMHWKTWEREVRAQLGVEYVLVRRPKRIYQARFARMLEYLNRHHSKYQTAHVRWHEIIL
jgi:hypothetical protein